MLLNLVYLNTLKKFELELSEQKQFVRVNKSVIVNLLFVNKINKDVIELCNGTIVKISRRRKKMFELLYYNQIP